MGRSSAHINQHSSIEVINMIYISHKPSPLHLVTGITMVFWATRGAFIHFIDLYKLRISLEGSVLLSSAALSHSDSALGYPGPLQVTVWVSVVCLCLHSSASFPALCSVCLLIICNSHWKLALTERDEQVWASNILYVYVLWPANVKFALCGYKQK